MFIVHHLHMYKRTIIYAISSTDLSQMILLETGGARALIGSDQSQANYIYIFIRLSINATEEA